MGDPHSQPRRVEPLGEFSFEFGIGKHQDHGGNSGGAQEHQEQLLQEDACPAFLITGE